MAKIVLVGAGGFTFSTTLLNDFFNVEALQGSTYVLFGPTMRKLERVEAYANKIISNNDIKAHVYSTTDTRDALKDADYVLMIFQVGGMEAYGIDYNIPLKYGVDQCIGQCVAPGGVFRALRTLPPIVDYLKTMEEVCPDAYVLNYVNPMAAISIGMGKSSNIKFVGLCHGVQTTLSLLAGWAGVPKEEVEFTAAGINHMAWFLKLMHNGRELYPIIREKIEKPEYYIDEKVRCEMMRHCGYFMTESSGHLSEYLPWFRSSEKALKLYCDRPGFSGESGTWLKTSKKILKHFDKADILSLESGKLESRSNEYCSYIIESLETDKIFKFNGNVINRGYITNLPDGCCVEVPCYVDKSGIHPTGIGGLPMQLAALNQSNVTVQLLAAEAALTGDPELAFAALANDPLTSSVLTLQETRDMAGEMFEASMKWLPQFKGKKLQPLGDVNIPEGTVPAPTPTDPAMAIAKRFGKLIGASVD